MLHDYQQQLRDKRKDNPITQGDFSSWRSHPLTKQFFEDLELLVLTHAGADYYEALDTMLEFGLEWEPECLESSDE